MQSSPFPHPAFAPLPSALSPRGRGRIAAPLFIILCALYLLGPLLVLIFKTFSSEPTSGAALTNADYARLWGLLLATLRIAAGATVLALFGGIIVALEIHRARGIYRRIAATLFPIPLLLPPAVVAIAWTHLLGKRGIATAAWKNLTGEPALPFSIYGEAGSAVVLALCWFPLVTMSALVGLRALDASAAQPAKLYASTWLRVRGIHLPLLLPNLTAAAACVAWLALGDFDVPSVFLRNAFPLEIYAALQIYPQAARAVWLCVPLLLLSAVILALRLLFAREKHAPTITSRWRSDAIPPRTSWSLRFAAWLILALGVFAPLAALIHQTGTLATLREGLSTAAPQVFNSFSTAIVGGLILMGIALPYAYLLRTHTGWRRSALSLLALLPLAIPGTIHGLAWTQTLLPHESTRALLNTPYIISLANAARFFPIGVFILSATLNALDARLDGAAQLAGASRLQRYAKITLPLIHPGCVAAFALGFAFIIGDLGCAILLNPVGYSTLPVRLSSLLHFGKDELLAGLCLTQVFLALVPYLIASVLLERALEVKFG